MREIALHIFNTLFPIFVVIGLGAYLRRSKFHTVSFVSGINKLTYYIALPALLFTNIASREVDFGIAGRTFLVVFAGMIGSIILAYILAYVFKFERESTGSFVQAAYRGNLVYIGLPVVIFSFTGSSSEVIAEVRQITVLVLSMIVPAYNVGAVIVLLASQNKLDRTVPLKITKQILTNPLIVACVLAVLYSKIVKVYPLALDRTFDALGAMALPLALLSIGAALVQPREGGAKNWVVFVASLIKVGFAPVVGFIVAKLMGLGLMEMKIALLLLACPTAAASYIITEQLGGDRRLAAAAIVVSSVLAAFSLGTVVGFFG